MNIVLTGPKCSGKSSLGRLAATRLGLDFVETDLAVEQASTERFGSTLTCREIVRQHGEEAFRQLEADVVEQLATGDGQLIATGGGTMLRMDNRRALRQAGLVVLLRAPLDVLWQRMQAGGVPPFLEGPDGRQRFRERIERLEEAVSVIADIVFETSGRTPGQMVDELVELIVQAVATRAGDPNTLGEIIRLTTFGESHGPAVGAVLDGVPPGIELSEGDIQHELDRRRPGQSRMTTQRREPDRVRILSGVFEGKTTGAPIGLLIENRDQDSSKYDNLKDLFRPGHADFTFLKKFGLRDHRGGGRSSGRETASRVAGGAVAKKILAARGVALTAHALEIAGIRAETFDAEQIERNPVRCADAQAAAKMAEAVEAAKAANDSVGGIVELRIDGLPAGLGDPVFMKLDARLAGAMMSLGAVKGVEIGEGFAAARLRGSQMNDTMRDGTFVTNHAGGILGGMSTGQTVVVRLAVKPTPSIARPQQSVTTDGSDTTVVIEGRHDPCIVPRIIPVVESMAALVVLDAWVIQDRLGGPLGE